jgi:hypothetical protein
MTKEIFVIDTSSFIKIEPENYPPDIFNSMWENLEKLIKNNRIISHIRVLEELEEYEGKKYEILKWTKNHKDVFESITPQQVNVAKEIVNTNNFNALMKSTKPTGDTDVFIIALAREKPIQMRLSTLNTKKIVVSEEKLQGNKINIPFVCKHFNIECINIFEMFRREGWKW